MDLFAGIVGSDGHLSRDRSTIFVINKDIQFLKEIVIPLVYTLTGKRVQPKFVNSGFSDGKYKINVSSKALWKTLNRRYNIPSGSKSSKIKPPALSNLKEKTDFMRGWISGDGSVTKDRTRPKIEIWSKSIYILKWMKDVLKKNGIESKIFEERKKREYILRIGKKKDVYIFYKKIKIPHPAKQYKLNKLCSKAF